MALRRRGSSITKDTCVKKSLFRLLPRRDGIRRMKLFFYLYEKRVAMERSCRGEEEVAYDGSRPSR